eukprot:59804-Prorocentrum_minimum.AAC.1
MLFKQAFPLVESEENEIRTVREPISTVRNLQSYEEDVYLSRARTFVFHPDGTLFRHGVTPNALPGIPNPPEGVRWAAGGGQMSGSSPTASSPVYDYQPKNCREN